MSWQKRTCPTCGAKSVCSLREYNQRRTGGCFSFWRPDCDACPDKEMTADKVRAWFEEARDKLFALMIRLDCPENDVYGNVAWCIGLQRCGHSLPADILSCFLTGGGDNVDIAAWAHAHLDADGEYHETKGDD